MRKVEQKGECREGDDDEEYPIGQATWFISFLMSAAKPGAA
jgi:hypothetical protein